MKLHPWAEGLHPYRAM